MITIDERVNEKLTVKVTKSAVSQRETIDTGVLNLTPMIPSRLPYTLCPLGTFSINCESIVC